MVMGAHEERKGRRRRGAGEGRGGWYLEGRELGGAMGDAEWGGDPVLLLLMSCCLLYVGRSKEKREKRKGRKGREKEKGKKKMRKRFKPENFRGEK
jgi:hypothetical protein